MSKKRYKLPSPFTNLPSDDKIRVVRDRINSPVYLDKAISEIAAILTEGILNPYIADKEITVFEVGSE